MWIGIALIILMLLSIIFVAIKDYQEERSHRTGSIIDCPECQKTFDASQLKPIVKLKNGTRYIVSCPYCNEVITVDIEDDNDYNE